MARTAVSGPGGGEVLAWPPTAEDLEAIEVVELSPAPLLARARGGPADVTSPAAPPESSPASSRASRAPGAPADTPAGPTSLVDVVELDARGGHETYIIDLRTGSAEEHDRAASAEAERASPVPILVGLPVEGRPLPGRMTPSGSPPSGDAPADGLVAARDKGGTHEAPPPVEWPPREVDLEAIHVVDLASEASVAAIALTPPALAPEAAARGAMGPAVTSPAIVARVERIAGRAARDRASRAEVVLPALEPPSPTAFSVGRLVALLGLAAVLGVAVAMFWTNWVSPVQHTSVPAPGAVGVPDVRAPEAPPVGGAEPGAATPVAVPDPLGQARAAYAAGDRLGALRMVTDAQRAAQPVPGAADLATEWLRVAQSQSEGARLRALQRGEAVAASDAYGAAQGRQRDAVTAWQAGRWEAAWQGFIDAERGFRAVLAATPAEARVAGSEPAPADAATPLAAPPTPPVPATPPPVRAEPTTPPPPALVELRPAEPSSPALPVAEVSRPAVPVPVVPTDEDAGVRRALRAYQGAYERLDARAAAAVYPSVDERALARAFDGLKSQKVEFDRCEVSLSAGRARAACVGRSAFVPRVGSQAPRVEARRWTFDLERRGDDWRITQATVGRP